MRGGPNADAQRLPAHHSQQLLIRAPKQRRPQHTGKSHFISWIYQHIQKQLQVADFARVVERESAKYDGRYAVGIERCLQRCSAAVRARENGDVAVPR
jgi:hypothetical protein